MPNFNKKRFSGPEYENSNRRRISKSFIKAKDSTSMDLHQRVIFETVNPELWEKLKSKEILKLKNFITPIK